MGMVAQGLGMEDLEERDPMREAWHMEICFDQSTLVALLATVKSSREVGFYILKRKYSSLTVSQHFSLLFLLIM